MDKERIDRVKRAMEAQGLDIIVCKNTENVLYLSGYWPVMGWSIVVFPLDDEPILIVPKAEIEYAKEGWIKDIRPYETERLEEIWNPYKFISGIFREIDVKEKAKVGCELYCETVATNSIVGEINYAGNMMFELIRNVWKAELVDITDMLLKLRALKTDFELQKIQLANELAHIGLESVIEKIRDGIKESVLAAEAEKSVYSEGVGYKRKVRRARAFAFVMSGTNSSKAWYPFNISTDRKIKHGDVVLIEFNVCADGYWADVTRTWILGKPNKEMEDVFYTVMEAQEEAFDSIADGVIASDVDKVARACIDNRGYGKFFPHRLGHGIGLRIHELPAIHPASRDILKRNMVVTIEPGIYTKDFGIRLEDDVIVLKRGIRNLTPFYKEFTLHR